MAERLDRYLASTTAQLFLGTIFTISIGLGITIGIGVFAGLFFFKYRQKQRGKLRTFSDAGGMTRINIDGLSDQPTKDD
jgi:ABC-type phosphate transport system permease subunit